MLHLLGQNFIAEAINRFYKTDSLFVDEIAADFNLPASNDI